MAVAVAVAVVAIRGGLVGRQIVFVEEVHAGFSTPVVENPDAEAVIAPRRNNFIVIVIVILGFWVGFCLFLFFMKWTEPPVQVQYRYSVLQNEKR